MLRNHAFWKGALGVALFFAVTAHAQSRLDFEGIDAVLTDNRLDEAATRYSSVILSFDPEQAAHLGFSSAYDKLTMRSPQHSTQMIASLRAMRDTVTQIDEKQLSESKKIDRELLLNAIDTAIWEAKQNPSRTDPLYYTQALDAVYDLVTKPLASIPRQRAALATRLANLPLIAEQAQQYLLAPSPLLAQIAMGKAYYAYLSADEWNEALRFETQNEDIINQNNRIVQNAKKAVKKMFDQFKALSQEQSNQDWRLGQENYFTLLRIRYQWEPQKASQLIKELENEVNVSQKMLTQALDPFLQQIAEEAEEITVVDEVDQPKEVKNKDKKKKRAKDLPPATAQDFYVVAKRIRHAEADPQPLQTLAQEANQALTFFVNGQVLPPMDIIFSIYPLPQYYSYTRSFLFLPPFGDQLSPRADFLLRIPSGNEQNRQQQFDNDFNAPTRKLMIASELVPGRYYQAQSTLQNDYVRRLYPSPSMLNGWAVYSRHLAKQEGFLNTQEDLAFFAWDEYQRTLTAFLDAKLHTRQYTYAEALNFLTQTHGFNEDEATIMLNQIAAFPGETVSFHIGFKALQEAHDTFSSKYGKKFNEADFNAKLFHIGNIPPAYLKKELSRLYSQESKAKKQKPLF